MRQGSLAAILAFAISAPLASGQTQTVGLFLNNAAATAPGYVLLPPMHNGMTYLIDNNGQIVHSWNSGNYEPGRMAYLLTNGHLLRADSLPNQGPPIGGGDGGQIREYNWSGNVLWTFQYCASTYCLHHDFKPLPNGDIIALMDEVKTPADMAAAGVRPDILQSGGDGNIYPDAVVEIQPTYPSGGNIVWQWHAWDHLVQNYDSTRPDYGTPAAHPELVDPNATYPSKIAAFWNHMNAIDYNSDLDQIMLSVRGNSEVWIIDHSTTTAQAAAHTGGKYGKGGDLLYRWGNPAMYSAGTAAGEMLYQQHDAQWIAAGLPGAGDALIYDNGVNRPVGQYSSADEMDPPVLSSGSYALASGSAYGPKTLAWTYAATGTNQMYTPDIGGAERLPNGNTIICFGTLGTIEEVTASGTVVWKYVSPVVQGGPLSQGQTPGLDVKNENLNAVFKVRKYAPDYAGLVGQDLTPKGTIEQYAISDVNAAGMQAGAAAPGGIMTLFGSSLADSAAVAATIPLPTTLAGTAVQVKDSSGATQSCSLMYVSATQINLVIPSNAALGAATLTIVRDTGGSPWVNIEIAPVAPGLFSMNASGKGVGAVDAVRTSAGGVQSDVPVFSYSSSSRQFVTVPIDLGAATDQVDLVLYATGVRGYSALSSITVTVGGATLPVIGVTQSAYPGLDLVSVGPLPRTLAGAGQVSVTLQVDGRTSNSVNVSIQ